MIQLIPNINQTLTKLKDSDRKKNKEVKEKKYPDLLYYVFRKRDVSFWNWGMIDLLSNQS